MRVTQAFTFEAAHRLIGVPPAHRCSRTHGHSYRVELTLEGRVHPKSGFVIDFFEVEAAFAPILARIDHHTLNDVAGLENPTAENIAIWIWKQTKPALPLLVSVRIYETPMCWADFAEQNEDRYVSKRAADG